MCVFARVWQCLSVCGTSNWQGRFAVCRNHWQRFAWLLLLRAAFAFWPTANEQTNKRTTERVNRRMNKRISERMTKQTLPVCICCVCVAQRGRAAAAPAALRPNRAKSIETIEATTTATTTTKCYTKNEKRKESNC